MVEISGARWHIRAMTAPATLLSRSLPRVMPLAIAAALAVGALGSAPASAQDVAVGGMDTVELYVTGRSVPGRPDLMTAWHGHAWLFVSDINRAAFDADPRRYAPGFDGLCPAALAAGSRVQGRPELAVMIGGRVYLSSSEALRDELLADPDGVLAAARNARR